MSEEQSNLVNEVYSELTQSLQPRGAALAILVGLPYSGKSTIATKFKADGFVHVWLTVIKRRYNLDDDAALHIARPVIERLLTSGYRVVFDFLNHTVSLRESFVKIAVATKAPCKIIWLNTPMTEIYRRQSNMAQTDASEGRSVISREVIDIIAREFEVPDGPDVLEITNEKSDALDAWLIQLDDSD